MSDQPEQAASSEADSPGTLLRKARQQMGLQVDAVADSLHLEKRIVLALEEGRQEELPAQTYVRGYMRAYARLVGADADQLAAMVDAAAVDRPTRLAALPPPSKPSLADRAHRHLGWVFGGIVAVVLAATAVVLWTVAPSFDWSLPWRVTVEEEIEPAAAMADVEVPPTPEAVAAPSPEAPTALPPSEPVSDVSADPVPDASAEPVADASAEPVAADAPSPETIQDTLIFHFNESSWVEIRDVDNKLIHSDLGKAGNTVEVQGEAPFDILIGYALGVRLTFNGDAVALGPHTRQNVARLVVGH